MYSFSYWEPFCCSMSGSKYCFLTCIQISQETIGTYISIMTLNINGINALNKRHRLAEWIQKQDPYICCLQETHFSVLAWRIPWTEEAGELQSMRSQRVGYNWSDWTAHASYERGKQGGREDRKRMLGTSLCISPQPPMKLSLFQNNFLKWVSSVQFTSVAQSCLTLCDPMNCSTPGLPVHHQLPEFTQTQVNRIGDAIQPSHPLSSPSPPAPSPSQHQSLFQWVNSSHEVAKVLEFQLQHQSFQRTPRTDLL